MIDWIENNKILYVYTYTHTHRKNRMNKIKKKESANDCPVSSDGDDDDNGCVTEKKLRETTSIKNLCNEDNLILQGLILTLSKFKTSCNLKIKYFIATNSGFIIVSCKIFHKGYRNVSELVNIVKTMDKINTNYMVKMDNVGLIIFYIPTSSIIKLVECAPISSAHDDSSVGNILDTELRSKTRKNTKHVIELYKEIKGRKELKSPMKESISNIVNILLFLKTDFAYETTVIKMEIYDPKYESFVLMVSNFEGELDLMKMYSKFNNGPNGSFNDNGGISISIHSNVTLLYNPLKASLAFLVSLVRIDNNNSSSSSSSNNNNTTTTTATTTVIGSRHNQVKRKRLSTSTIYSDIQSGSSSGNKNAKKKIRRHFENSDFTEMKNLSLQ